MQGYLRIGYLTAQPCGIDPFHACDPDSQTLIFACHDGLTAIDDKGCLVPALSTEWNWLNENCISFRLREGVYFHNGEPFNALAVKATFEAHLNAIHGSLMGKTFLSTLAGVEIIDDYTVNFHTKNSDLMLPWRMVYCSSIVPPRLLENIGLEGFLNNPVGTGPFIFESMEKDREIRYRLNPDYWGKKPGVRGIRFIIMPSQYWVEALERGQLDLVHGLHEMQLHMVQRHPKIKIKSHLALGHWFLLAPRGFLLDKRVRLAFNLAVDLRHIASVWSDDALSQTCVGFDSQFGANSQVSLFFYNSRLARRFLDEAGCVDQLRLYGLVSDDSARLVQLIAPYLEAINIILDYDIIPRATWMQRIIESKKVDGEPLFDFAVAPIPNPVMHSGFHHEMLLGQNGLFSIFHDPGFEEQLQLALRANNLTEQKQQFESLDQFVHDAALLLFGIHSNVHLVMRDGINAEIGITGYFNSFVFSSLVDERTEIDGSDWDFRNLNKVIDFDQREFDELFKATEQADFFYFPEKKLQSEALNRLANNFRYFERNKNLNAYESDRQIIYSVNRLRDIKEALDATLFSGIASFDMYGNMMLSNHAFLKLLDLEKGDVLLSNLFLTEENWNNFYETVTSEGGFNGSLNLKRSSYDILEAQVNCSLRYDRFGEPKGYILIIRDESEERSLRTQLQQSYISSKRSEEEHRTLVENSTLGIFRINGASPGKFIQVNPAMREIFQYSNLPEILRSALLDIFVDPKEYERLLEIVTSQGECKGFEVYCKRKDGNCFWALINARGHLSQSGILRCMDGILEDINERKRSEQLLEDYHQRLEADVIARTRELSQTLDELKAAQEGVIHAEKLAALGQLVGGVAQEIKIPSGVIESAIREVDQGYTALLEHLLVFIAQLDENQRNLYISACQHVGKHALNERSTTEQRTIARGIRHYLEGFGLEDVRELSQDLAFIGFDEASVAPIAPLFKTELSQSIRASLTQFGSSCLHVRDIKSSIGRITRLVKALKSYSHLDEGKLVVTKIEEDLENTLIILSSELKKGGVKVIADYEQIPLVRCCADELNQVWTNLIHNSIQSMKGGGKIYLRLRLLDEAHFFVEVEDTGPGIPDEILPHIFESSFNGKVNLGYETSTLNACKRIITKQSGQITVVSGKAGQTIFRIILPFEVPSEQASDSKDDSQEKPHIEDR